MAFAFNFKPVAVVKGRSTTSTDTYTIPGVTVENTTPANAATQINKILSIVDREIAGDQYMTRTIVEESVENE